MEPSAINVSYPEAQSPGIRTNQNGSAMDVWKHHIPTDYVLTKTEIDRQIIYFGLQYDLISPRSASILASTLDDHTSLIEWINRFAANAPFETRRREPPDPTGPRAHTIKKWLYVILSWILDNPDRCPEPLRSLELVYSDFGYPTYISSFVPYTSSNTRSLVGTRAENEAALIQMWVSWLADTERSLASTSAELDQDS